MPPLRRVTSCSPSASARTVTAHSLNAIGIIPSLREFEMSRREAFAGVSPSDRYRIRKLPKSPNFAANSVVFRAFERVPQLPPAVSAAARRPRRRPRSPLRAYPRFAADPHDLPARSSRIGESARGPRADAQRPTSFDHVRRAKQRRVVVRRASAAPLASSIFDPPAPPLQHRHHRVEVDVRRRSRRSAPRRPSTALADRHGVVDHLDRLAIAERSDMEDRLALIASSAGRACAKSPALAADHDQQRAVAGARESSR